MKDQKGFIQIPILITIVVGMLALGVAGYIGVKQYKISQSKILEKVKQAQKLADEQQQALKQAQTEIEKLQQEDAGVKNKQKIQEEKNIEIQTAKQNINQGSSEIYKYVIYDAGPNFIEVLDKNAENKTAINMIPVGSRVKVLNIDQDFVLVQFENHKGYTQPKWLSDIPLTSLNLAEVIKEWRPRVANIQCIWQTFNIAQSGSGLFMYSPAKGITIYTNAHVLNYQGVGPNICYIKLPDDPEKISVVDNFFLSASGYDWGLIRVDAPSAYMKSLSDMLSTSVVTCLSVSLGEQVIILGYPTIGSKTDITVTDGIISGFDGDYYITSAKVEHGNSGGAAIIVRQNKSCYLGIPSFVEVGSVESLARILDVKNLNK